jgi:hypothetical protein
MFRHSFHITKPHSAHPSNRICVLYRLLASACRDVVAPHLLQPFFAVSETMILWDRAAQDNNVFGTGDTCCLGSPLLFLLANTETPILVQRSKLCKVVFLVISSLSRMLFVDVRCFGRAGAQ